MDAPALGFLSRSARDEARRAYRTPATRGQRRTRRSWPSRRGASSPRSIDCGFWRRQRDARSFRRGGPSASPEGLYSSHLTEHGAGRGVRGRFRGLTAEQTRSSEARRAQPPQREGARSSRRKWLGWRMELHLHLALIAIRSWTSREKLPGCWDSASNTGRTADGLLQARSHQQVAAWHRRAERWGCLRASFYRRQRPAPGHQQPRPTPARALCASERAHVLTTCSPRPRFVDRSPAEVANRDAAR